MPACKTFLLYKIKRANFVASMWKNANLPERCRFQPEDNGWVMQDGLYHIKWFEGEQVPQSVHQAIIGILAKRITQIFSGNDVIRNLPASSALTTDEYMMSLLEQEICYRSAVFIGVDYSNWSDFIFDERQAEGRPSYHLNELPGVPEELASSMYF
ncbi:uncharacterized protein LOC144345214 [Saccoglossus kowalevskii]